MRRPVRGFSSWVLASVGVVAIAIVVTVAGAVMAILGANLACMGGGSALAAPATKAAVREIPSQRLRIYQAAGRRFDVSWPFLASIGYQECGHGACAQVYPSGCAGPMAIGYVRGSACSPNPSAPTIWERYRFDGNGDGKTDVLDPADAVFTAARMMRPVFGLAGDSYAAYRQVACNYYGACGDSVADYAKEVMARAVEYGFRGDGAPAPTGGPASEVVATTGGSGSACEGGGAVGTATGSEIVRIAQSQLGTLESPPGTNCNPYGPCVEWCSLFVAWVWKRAGVPLEGSTATYAYSGTVYKWAKAHEGGGLPGTPAPGESPFSDADPNGARVLAPTEKPAPGDAVLYGTGPEFGESLHIGIVERVFPNGEITTIDGNLSDRVARAGPFHPSRAATYGMPGPVFGFAHPPSAGGGDA